MHQFRVQSKLRAYQLLIVEFFACASTSYVACAILRPDVVKNLGKILVKTAGFLRNYGKFPDWFAFKNIVKVDYWFPIGAEISGINTDVNFIV